MVASVGTQRGGRDADVSTTRLAQRKGAGGQHAEGGRRGALRHQVADRAGGREADDAHPQLVAEAVAVVERGLVGEDGVALAGGGEAHRWVGVTGQRAGLVERERAAVAAVVLIDGQVRRHCAGRLTEAPVGARCVGQDDVGVAAARAAAPLVRVGDRLAARPAAWRRGQNLACSRRAGDGRQGGVDRGVRGISRGAGGAGNGDDRERRDGQQKARARRAPARGRRGSRTRVRHSRPLRAPRARRRACASATL